MKTGLLHTAFWLLAFTTPAVTAASTPGGETEFETLIASMCQKRVVMLGEDAGHGAGTTLSLKGRIVQALVDQCGFDTLYFEAPVYEFLDLEERQARMDARPEHLADAIGPVWAGTKEFEPTLRWLWQRSQAGTLRLRGLDVQMGGISQHFSERDLPTRLSAHADPKYGTCEASLARLTRWDFPASHPYDDAFRQELRQCLSGIERTLATPEDDTDRFSHRMAVSLQHFLDMSDGNDFNIRDAAMAQTFAWYHDRTPGERAIIWTATSHAVKGPLPGYPDRVPLGMHLSGQLAEQLASIGFSARTGRHGRPSRPPTDISHSDAALEQRTDVDSYVDSMALHRIGLIPSSTVAYTRPLLAEWSTLLDGIWLLPTETPLHTLDTTGQVSTGTSPQM